MDARLAAALDRQLTTWRTTLEQGAERVGWKLGMGDRERIGTGPVIGYLTSASRLAPGAVFRGAPGDLAADAEVALLIGSERSIAGYGVALEIVDLGGDADAEAIVASNVFHRAVALSAATQRAWHGGIEASLAVNGKRVAAGRPDGDLCGRVRVVEELLCEMGEELLEGDWLITGSVVQVRIQPGDEIVADLGPVGRVGLTIAAELGSRRRQ